MIIKFHKNAIKFLEKCPEKDKKKIRSKVSELHEFYSGINLSNYHNLNVKHLEGKWKGFSRIKIGKLRIVFQADRKNEEIMIYEIDYRGDIYK